MRYYYRLMIAIAAAVALGAMAAFGGGSAEAADPGSEPIGFFELIDAQGNPHCIGVVKNWEEGGARPTLVFAQSSDCEPERPAPTPTPTPVVERDVADDPIVGVAQVWQCQPRGDEPCAFRVLAHDGYHLAP